MQKNKRSLAFGIISLAPLTIMAGAAVSPALADIKASFSGVSPTLIKMILTLPAVFIIPTSYVVGRLASKISKKKLVLTGVLLYTLAGCSAFFTNDIYSLLASRAALGVAVGIIMPLAAALIADFFQGEEKLQMMSFNAAFANFGGIIATFSSGLLAVIDWRYAFLVYLVGIPVLVIGSIFIKDPVKTSAEIAALNGRRLPLETYFTAFPAFLIFLGFYSIPTNIAVYLVSKGLGGPEHAGYALAFSTGTAMLMGLMTAKVKKATGRWFVPSITLTMLICHLLLGFTTSVIAVNIAMVANGYTLSMSIPYIMHRATESSNGYNVGATSLVTVFVFLGQFFSPIVLDGIAKTAGYADASVNYKIVAAGSLAALVFTVLRTLRRS